MTDAQKQDIKQYQVGNFIKLDNKIYEIQRVDITNKTLFICKQNTKEMLSIYLENTNTSYLQYYIKQNLEISTGELIKFTQNDKSKGIANNDEYIVKQINTNDLLLKSYQNPNKILSISKDDLQHIDYSYTKTIHSSQGLTADKTILELDYRSPTTSKNVYYAAISRARHKVKIYTNDIEKTKKAVQKEQQKSSSIDIGQSLEIKL